jgi:hypothetical protein
LQRAALQGCCGCSHLNSARHKGGDLNQPEYVCFCPCLLLWLQASEVAERLVDAQLAAGDLQGARHTLRQALEARIALLGRWGRCWGVLRIPLAALSRYKGPQALLCSGGCQQKQSTSVSQTLDFVLLLLLLLLCAGTWLLPRP